MLYCVSTVYAQWFNMNYAFLGDTSHYLLYKTQIPRYINNLILMFMVYILGSHITCLYRLLLLYCTYYKLHNYCMYIRVNAYFYLHDIFINNKNNYNYNNYYSQNALEKWPIAGYRF